MDLIGALTSQLGTSEGKAKGLAGELLHLVQGAVKEEVSEEAAAELAAATPEAQQWRAEGETPAAGEAQAGGGFGDLLGAGMQMLGASGGTAGLVAGVAKLIEKFGLEPSHAAIAAPLVAKFIESKVDPGLMSKIAPVLGALAGGGGGAPSGGGGLLGGLFG